VKKGTGWYEEHGRTYNVNTCQSCGAAVTMTANQLCKLRPGNPVIHYYFDKNIPCCDNPDFLWGDLA